MNQKSKILGSNYRKMKWQISAPPRSPAGQNCWPATFGSALPVSRNHSLRASQRTATESLLRDLPAVLGHFERRLLYDVR